MSIYRNPGELFFDQKEWLRLKIEMKQNFKAEAEKILSAVAGATEEALRRGALVIVDHAKARVPKKSGLLAANIKVGDRKRRGKDERMISVRTNTKGSYIRDGIIYDSKGRSYGETKPFKTKEYTDKRGRKRGGRMIRIMNQKPNRYGYGFDVEKGRPSGNYTPTPYLIPAMKESIEKFQQIMKEETAKRAKNHDFNPTDIITGEN